jgi:hypothetical protein
MSPMSTAAMNAVDRTKAGVASGVLSMSRMVGGTFGVAVTGALVTAIGKSQINQGLPQLASSTRSAIANALGSGAIPDAHGSPHVATVVRQAFVSALGTGLTIGAAVTICGAGLAWVLIQRSASVAPVPAKEPVADEESEAEAELSLV